jgi:hypothetical protein
VRTTALALRLKIPAALRQKWLEVLRSPEYQGRETYTQLHCEGDYCAIGLLAHAYGLDAGNASIVYPWLEHQGVDPVDLCKPFDRQRMTFAQFADWLEAHSEPVE